MAKKDTIQQQDVSEAQGTTGIVEAPTDVVETTDETQEKGQAREGKTNPRRSAMDDIAARRTAELESQESTDKPEKEEQAEPTDQKQESNKPPIFERDGVWMTRVKVNGVEEDIPLDKVTARYQKDAAGDEKLRLAAERERQIAEQAKQLQAYEAHLRQLQKQAPSQPSNADAGSLSVSEQDLAEAFYSGDAKQVASAMRKFRESLKADLMAQTPPQQQVDQNAIVKQVEQEIGKRDAVKAFHSEFKDVASDPYLFQLADQFSAQLLSQEPNLAPRENLMKAGEMVRNWLAERGVKASEPTVATTDKQQRKVAATSRVAAASNVRSSVGADAPPPMKPSDVIAEMRRARGQPV